MTTSPDLSGTLLGGRYRLRSLLGRGGMGSVYAAVQEDLGRSVAVKILDPLLACDPGQLERFRREALASAALGHPNIVQVTDFSAPTNTQPPFLVMELLAGQSLGQLLDRESVVAPQRIAFIASQLLSALGAAHAAGIVHRDIKPDNVFLVSTSAFHDLVKVLDFGIAKLATEEGGARLTGTGAMLGTPAYMAPEQARGAVVDHRADLYAVGATMYQALAGRLPHDAPSFPAMLFAIVEQTPEPLGRLRPDLPPSLVAVVERAMVKDPNARFRSAEEMRAALAPFVPAGSVAPAPVSHDAPTMAGTADPASAGQPTPVIVRSSPPPSGTPISSMSKTPSPVSNTRSEPAPVSSGGGLVKAALVIAAGLVIVALIGGGTMVMMARAKNEREALRDLPGLVQAATALTASAGVVTTTAPPALASASAEASAVSPLGSSKVAVAARPSASASASAVAALAPPPASGKAYGGKSGVHSGGNFGDCPNCEWEAWNAEADRREAQISACYKASEFEPPRHEYGEYIVHVNAEGKIGAIEVAGDDKTPNFDACLMGVIRSIPLVKHGGGPGSFHSSFTGRCKTFECQ